LAYKVEITDAALAEAEEYVQFILKQSNDDQAALNWRDGLIEAITSLQNLPGRCPLVPEQRHFAVELHQLLYASHRIIFRIEPGLVTVVRIYHAARKPITKLATGTLPKSRKR
jgi:plasmid stabilization system protein ParE